MLEKKINSFNQGPYPYTRATTKTTPSKKMCFYFTLKFPIYLDLFSVSVGIKTCPCRICYECVHFQLEIRKLSRCGSRSPNNAEFGHFTLLFCRGRQRNVSRIITHVHSYCPAH